MIQSAKTVLVTGISGYIGLHCARELLEQGHQVRGSVRSTEAEAIAKFTLARSVPRGESVKLYRTNLLRDDGWCEAMEGCDAVLHVASPFIMGEPRHPDDLIKPAVEGTVRVMRFAEAAGVKRVVLTSSTMAVSSDMESGVGGPKDWADPDRVGSYAKSKILAERAAWDFIAAQTGDKPMELVVINPGGVMGPCLTGKPRGTSTRMISDMIDGRVPMVPDLAFCMVDVRDVARVHVTALDVSEAAGKRFILASEEPIPLMHLAQTLKEAGFDKVATRKAPSLLLRLMAPFNKEVKGMVGFLGRRVRADNKETRQVLGWVPTPLETSVVEMAKSFR